MGRQELFSVFNQEILEVREVFRSVEERELFPFAPLEDEVFVFVTLKVLLNFVSEALRCLAFEDDLSGCGGDFHAQRVT